MDREALRAKVRRLAEDAGGRGEPYGWFEPLYADSGGSTDCVPWADDEPNPHFVAGMELEGVPRGGRALVLGCGFGDDAEELAARGFDVTGFDVSPSAIEWCARKHPGSPVTYEVQDLFALPEHYVEAFDFVLEVYTLQAIPLPARTAGFAPVADCVAPGGALLCVMRGRDDDQEPQGPPWPISRAECAAFEARGLVLVSWESYHDDEDPPQRRFRALFRKPAR